MALEKILHDLHAKTHKKMLGTLAGPLAVAVLYGFGRREFPPLRHVLEPLFAFALAWSFAGLIFLHRGMWRVVMPGEAGLTTGLESCRREIERRRSLLRRMLLWSFAPVLLALGTLILALALIGNKDRGIFPNGLPFLVLVAAWLVGYFVVRVREQHQLQREIDELNKIERENRR